MRIARRTVKLKFIVAAIVCGLLLSLATGLVENPPSGVGIPEYRHFGSPLVWRVTKTLEPTEYRLANLAIDVVFWVIISFLALIILEVLKSKSGFAYETLLLPLALFIPLGLVMDFVHEFGHAMWGTAVGGRLTYMKIAYFEIYPRPAMTSIFELGRVQVVWDTPSATAFEYGLFLLGGSLTTNVVAWLLVLILLIKSFRFKTQIVLRMLGLFGLLDLPFYVLFPQMGLRHWVFLGGCQPEPLIGARRMGIPDPIFYTMVALTTIGLVLLYFKSSWEKVVNRTKVALE